VNASMASMRRISFSNSAIAFLMILRLHGDGAQHPVLQFGRKI
jgi:hypothetical protein